jgi:hypothetical protein
MRKAKLARKTFQPREGFEPQRLRDARRARIWYSRTIARWKVERGARPLEDGAAVLDAAVGSPEWLVGEILSDRGEAVVLEPEDLRAQVAERAVALAAELRAGAPV